jgi:hypothetical protein
VLSLQVLIDAGHGECGIGPEIDAPDPAAITLAPPAEKATVRQDQAGQASIRNGRRRSEAVSTQQP